MPRRNSQFPIVKNILETKMHVRMLEQNSTNIGISWFVMVLHVTSEWCEDQSC